MKKKLQVGLAILVLCAAAVAGWGVYRYGQISKAIDAMNIGNTTDDSSRAYDRPSIRQMKRDFFMTGYLYAFFYKSIADSMGLSGGEKVLDFGCGSGAPDIYIADTLSRSSGSLTCMDISPLWQRVARLRLAAYTNVEYICGDITSLPIKENSYDVILVNYVIHGIDKSLWPGIGKALARVLKPGGRLHINEPDEEGHSMSMDEIRVLMTGSGLKEVSLVRTKILGLVMPRNEGVFMK